MYALAERIRCKFARVRLILFMYALAGRIRCKFARVRLKSVFKMFLANMLPINELPVLLGHVQDEKAPFESKELHEPLEPLKPQSDSVLDSVHSVLKDFNPQLFAACARGDPVNTKNSPRRPTSIAKTMEVGLRCTWHVDVNLPVPKRWCSCC